MNGAFFLAMKTTFLEKPLSNDKFPCEVKRGKSSPFLTKHVTRWSWEAVISVMGFLIGHTCTIIYLYCLVFTFFIFGVGHVTLGLNVGGVSNFWIYQIFAEPTMNLIIFKRAFKVVWTRSPCEGFDKKKCTLLLWVLGFLVHCLSVKSAFHFHMLSYSMKVILVK